MITERIRPPTTERIRPPSSEPKKNARTIQKREYNPIIEQRINLVLKEYRVQLMRHGSKGPSMFYGSDRFKKSRRYKQVMSIFAGVVEHLDELRYLNNSQIPWERLVADWFAAVFEHYNRSWNKCPLPMQVSPTKMVTAVFNMYTQKYTDTYDGEINYWSIKPDNASRSDNIAKAIARRENELQNMRNISPLWDDKHILKDLRNRFGPHVKSINDYIQNGGLLDEQGRRRPADWV